MIKIVEDTKGEFFFHPLELGNDNDLAVYGFCKCGNPVFGQLMKDLHDCSGNLICGLCIEGLDWKDNLYKKISKRRG